MTFKDVYKLYYKIAKRYVDMYECKFELEELVDEAWLRTYKRIDEDKLPHRIHFAIRDYIREQKIRYRQNFEYIEPNIEHMIYWDWEWTINYEKENQEYETLEPMIRKLSFDERILLYLRHVLELTESRIGKLFGVEFQGVKYDVAPNVISYRLKCIYDNLRVA